MVHQVPEDHSILFLLLGFSLGFLLSSTMDDYNSLCICTTYPSRALGIPDNNS